MRKRIYFVFFAIIVLIVFSSCGTIQTTKHSEEIAEKQIIIADYPLYDTAEQLVENADLVFSGKVKSIKYEMLDIKMESEPDSLTGLEEASSMPYTIFEIEVFKMYKGDATDQTIYLKRPGGNFDTIYELKDATQINEGGEYLFVAKTFENFYPSLLNANQAVYDITTPETIAEHEGITLSQILNLFKE